MPAGRKRADPAAGIPRPGICLALHREYGWSTKRIMRTIVAAQNIHNENVEAGRSDADLWDMVANETGITLDKYYPGGEDE